MATKQSATLGIQKDAVIRNFRITAAETPTLAEMIASFEPDRHGGEVMVAEPVGVEEG